MLVGIGRVLCERLNCAADPHIFKGATTLLVDAEVADRKESDAPWRLRWTNVIGNDVKQLLKSSVAYQILAEGIGVPDEVSKGTSRVSSRLLLRVFQKINEKFDAGPQMLVQHFVVEAGVSNSEAGKFARVTVRVLAAGNSCLNQSVLEELLVEVAGVSAQIAD